MTTLAQLVAVVVEAKLTGVPTAAVAGTVAEHWTVHTACAEAWRNGSANEMHKPKIKTNVMKFLICFAGRIGKAPFTKK
ncbi:MAG: hypothetical protein ABIU20_06035 [Blastocatellia bacterium]